MRNFFITGTDTDVGKTFVTCALLQAFAMRGLVAAPMKPIAAGTIDIGGELMNTDVVALREVSATNAALADINPYCFSEPIAPHLAATHEKVVVEIAVIRAAFDRLSAEANTVLVEGAGGFLVPLSEMQSMAEIPRALTLEVILVVGMRLGVLNHDLLTVEAIEARGLKLAGWVANIPLAGDTMMYLDENISTLSRMIAAPLLGIVPHDHRYDGARKSAQRAAHLLNIEPLVSRQ